MTTDEAVKKIISATKFSDVVDLVNYKKDYQALAMLVHQDKTGSAEAISKLNVFKDHHEKGTKYEDEAGDYYTNNYWIKRKITKENRTLLQVSYENFLLLKSMGIAHMEKYLPARMVIEDDNMVTHFHEDYKRTIPLPESLEQKHTNWVLSRLLEFIMMINKSQMGFAHCGLNPTSVFIVPENHGIKIASFYHMTKIGTKARTINGEFSHWYPPQLLKTKIANSMVDIETSKKIAIWLLGDKSGVGIKLKKTHNEQVMNFMIRQDADPHLTYDEWRGILDVNFPRMFHKCDI